MSQPTKFMATWVPEDLAAKFQKQARAEERSGAAQLRVLIAQYVNGGSKRRD